MGNAIPVQLAQFFRSILLGGTLALTYDIARALRVLGGTGWELLLDTAVSLGSIFSLFLLVMAEEGELRLFILLGTLGGAVLFFVLLSPVLRPVLCFWVDVFVIPIRLSYKILRKLQFLLKKVFSFPHKWFTIIGNQWTKILRREREDGPESRTTENRPQQ